MLWYLQSDRYYNYNGIRVKVKKGVFHPGLFFSTKFLLKELMKENLRDKTLLELGAGSGLISIIAAKQGAKVTASDINQVAIEGLSENMEMNNSKFEILLSDLFDAIPLQTFDYIIINPPYYAKQPGSDAEKAWFCGENFEYFERLFPKLGNYRNSDSTVWITLSEDCEVSRIQQIAEGNQWKLKVYRMKQTGWEKHFIFSVN